MKRTLLTLLSLLIFLVSYSQSEKFSQVRVNLGSKSIAAISALGISTEEGASLTDQWLTIVLSADELAKVQQAGFQTVVVQEDYSKFIEERNRNFREQISEINSEIRDSRMTTTGYEVPAGFSLGSMGGFYTAAEIFAKMDSLHNNYPDLVSARTQATSNVSIEGRPLWYFKISDNPNVNEDEPKVFYNALIHSREPMAMQQLFFFMNYLVENYNTDEEIKYLVDNVQMYFLPLVNPDGYHQNEQTFPIGGGMWRKNKRNNLDGSYGVDLNRNFGYMWGYDNVGSSPVTTDDTYRGSGPFSEPETQIIRDFCDDMDFNLILNYHTYSDLFLYPWSYITQDTPDSNTFRTYAELMTRENSYTTGVPGAVLYNTNGDANDWLYGDLSLHPMVYSFTPEIGTDADGFWPQPTHIIPLAQENMRANLLLAHLSYRYAEAGDESPVILANREGHLRFSIERYGLNNEGTYTVSLRPVDSTQVISTGTPVVFNGMSRFETRHDSIAYTLSPDLLIGTEIKFLLQVNNGFYTHSDTIRKYFGPPLVVFSDSCDDMSKWNSPKWNVSTTQFFSAPGSLTDSPSGLYGMNENNSITMNDLADLLDSPVAVIEYMAKWSTEKGFDYVQVKAGTGVGYTPLSGKYTHPGTANEVPGQPVYDGIKKDWVHEQIITTDYVNKDIRIRFTLNSDSWAFADGFYFDDFRVTVIDMSSVGIRGKKEMTSSLSNPVPNPATDRVRINYSCTDDGMHLALYDTRGILVNTWPVETRKGSVTFNTNDLVQGLYYLRLEGNGKYSETRKLVVIR